MELRCRGVKVFFHRNVVLNRVTLNVGSGEMVSIQGVSGSGKSTLIDCLTGIRVPDEGSVSIGSTVLSNQSVDERARLRLRTMGLVWQRADLLPELTVLENVSLRLRLLGVQSEIAAADASAALEAVGLAQMGDRMPDTLSGGEQMRVALARAVAHSPGIVMADEPTGALDRANSEIVGSILRGLTAAGQVGVIVATHDERIARLADRRFVLDDGELTAIT